MLGLDFSTMIFQAINFFILLAVLSWFFYRPLQRIMRQRESAITERIDQADRRAREAEAEREGLAAQQREVAKRAEDVVAAARKRAGDERDRLLEEARTEAARLVETATRTAGEREASVLARSETRVSEAAVNIAANLIRTAAGEQVHHALLERLLSGDPPSELSSKLFPEDVRARGDFVVESAYPLTQDERDRLAALVATATLASDPPVEVRVDAGLIAGVRILSRDLVVDMSLRRALEDLRAGAPDAT